MRGSRSERAAAYAVVVAQTVLVVHVFWPRPRNRPPGAPARFAAGVAMGAGAVVATAGAGTLGADLTPMPLPPQGGRLRTAGPYALVRHPVYAGVMLASVARGLIAGGRSRPAAAAALCALLSAKARWEEQQLRARFPEYDEYARRTPRFVPRPGGPRDRRGRS